MDRLQFDSHKVLEQAGTPYPGVQSAGALCDQIKYVLDQVNLLLLPERGVKLDCRRTASDPAGLKFEIILV